MRHFGVERNVFIVGTGPRARDLAQRLEPYRRYGLEILGFLAVSDLAAGNEGPELDYPVFPLDGLRTVLAREFIIDEVFFAAENHELAALDDACWCDEEGIADASLPPTSSSRHRLHQGLLRPARPNAAPDKMTGAPGDDALLLTKRAIDIVLSASGLILLSPVFLLVALLVKITSRGPVIFRQARCGLNGRPFTCYKFRTMVRDAEARLHEVKHLNTRGDIVTKIPNDPRLTAVGGLLRRFSLDELPQLFNVLRGDMSLVGPRPAIPSEVAQYQRWQRRRLRMRPGLTCLWALKGRDKVDFDAWMRLDMHIDNWSLGLDARIILLTIPQCAQSGRGASYSRKRSSPKLPPNKKGLVAEALYCFKVCVP